MLETVIEVENLSKQYQLGVIGSGTLSRDLQRWWANFRGKEDPNGIIGQWDNSQLDETQQRFWALNNVSFNIKRGEIVGIIGHNGAGKSTLLKILSKVTGPTSGRIRIKGKVASLLEVGTGFHPELTGRENVYLNGAILGMKKLEIDKNFDEIVEFAEIAKFIDTPVKRYSSGMYVRLAFAVAAHLEPDILIVDEVLAVGDTAFQKKCLGKMEDVQRSGRTILFVSHNMGAVANLCNRGILLNHGTVEMDGEIKEVIGKYHADMSEEQLPVVELEATERHSGPGEIGRIIRVSMYDENGDLNSKIKFGRKVNIKIDIKANKEMPIEFGFAIFTNLGQRVSHVVSSWEKFTATLPSGISSITCHIPSLTILPGQYTASFWIIRPGGFQGGSDDFVDRALYFEVIEGDINGIVPSFNICHPGEVYIKSSWELRG